MYVGGGGSMRKSFKDSLKVLEADIHYANTLASDFPREYDGACLQMRMSYSPAAPLFLFLVQWTDCNLAGALGLLRVLIYKVYVDGTTTMSTHERKASIREFYAVIYPSLLQLQRGLTDTEDKKQKAVCMERYRRRDDEEHRQCLDIDIEREEECGICMEMNSKIVLPNCNHAMCLKCYREWRSRSQSCPFCRDSLKRVNSGDLWVFMDSRDVIDMATVKRENLRRLFVYIDKLPLIVPDTLFDTYDGHLRSIVVKDGIFCIFTGSLDNTCHLRRHYGLSRQATEAMLLIEAYKVLRDRAPYPPDQVVKELEGKFAFILFDSNAANVFLARDRDGSVEFHWGMAADGSLVCSDDQKIIIEACGNCYGPFPPGCIFMSQNGLISFDHPLHKVKAIARDDNEGKICSVIFQVDLYKRLHSIPRTGSAANWGDATIVEGE